MDESKGGLQLPNFLWSGLILVGVAVLGYFRYGPPLESRRPRDAAESRAAPQLPDSALTRYARLWEDPLTWSCSADASKCEPFEIRFRSSERMPLILPVMLDGSPGAYALELRLRTRYAVLAALATARYRPEASQRLRHLELRYGDNSQPILVPYERFAPDVTESSRGYDRKPPFDEVLVCWLDEERFDDKLQAIRELIGCAYAHSNLETLQSWIGQPPKVRVVGPSNSDVLVAMAEESQRQPLGPEYFVPPQAGGCRDCGENMLRVELYSPRATIEPAVLRSAPERHLRSFIQVPLRRTDGRLAEECLEPSCVEFHGVIGTDWHLVHALYRELVSRGCWPDPLSGNERIVLLTEMDTAYGRGLAHLLTHVVGPATLVVNDGTPEMPMRISASANWLPKGSGVVERSPDEAVATHLLRTASRAPAAFRLGEAEREANRLQRDWTRADGRPYGQTCFRLSDARKQGSQGRWRPPKFLSVYKYLRGIDGRTAGRGTAETQASTEKKTAPGGIVPAPAQDYNPTGTSQCDYLRRLEIELVELQRSLRGAGGGGITAIGVVGTDVYDKLLILRMLRKRFPGMCFFTTDMEAEYSRPSELPYTRNLVVASHLGLSLHPWLQREVPAFRDVYQTSTFLATLLAVEDRRASQLFGHARPKRNAVRPADDAIWPAPTAVAELPGDAPATEPWMACLERDPWLRPESDADRSDSGSTQKPVSELERSYLAPLIFEIGRTGPYQLTMTTEGGMPPRGFVRPRTSGPEAGEPSRDDFSLQALLQTPSKRQSGFAPLCGWPRFAWLMVAAAAFLMLLFSFVRRFFGPFGYAAARLFLGVWWMVASATRHAVQWAVRPAWVGPRFSGLRSWASQAPTRVAPVGRDPRQPIVFGIAAPLVLAGLAAALVWFVAEQHSHGEYGEPFALAEGLSVWPSTLLRFAVFALSALLMAKGMRDLMKQLQRFERQLSGCEEPQVRRCEEGQARGCAEQPARGCKMRPGPPLGPRAVPASSGWRAWLRAPLLKIARRCVRPWRRRHAGSAQRGGQYLLAAYRAKASWGLVTLRAIAWSMLFVAVTAGMFAVGDDWAHIPARNVWAALVVGLVLAASVIASLLLTFFVIDATSLCRRFVAALGQRSYAWRVAHAVIGTRRLTAAPDAASELATVRIIAERTDVVSKLLLYPFCMVVLLIVARHSVFDDWDLPLSLLLSVLILLVVITVHALMLRHEAGKTRVAVLARLRRLLVGAADARQQQIKWVIEEVEREREGAFRPLTEDWLFKALAILFSGSGGIVLIEQLLPTLQ
jgi:hypothetical protein